MRAEGESRCELKPALGAFAGQARTANAQSAGRKRVLRGGGATHPTKRRQRAKGPCDSAAKLSGRRGRRRRESRPAISPVLLLTRDQRLDRGPRAWHRARKAPQEPERSRCLRRSRRYREAREDHSGRDGHREVAERRSTKKAGELTRKDPVEGRALRAMELLEGKTMGTLGPDNVSTKQQRIAMLAKQMKGVALTSLSHHIDIDWMKQAYRRTRKDGAEGVDGQTAAEYEATLEENLRSLLDRAKSGTYRAPPVRRVHIPKGDGKSLRPIGIPTLEDKVLQRAVVM